MLRSGLRGVRLEWLIGAALLAAPVPVLGQADILTLEWDSSTGSNVAGYKVYVGNGSHQYALPAQFVPAGQTTFVFAATPGVRYYFAVTAVDITGVESPLSDEVSTLISTSGFIDDPLIPGFDVMRVVHIAELRGRINMLRTANGLLAMSWTDPTLGFSNAVRAVHLQEMRTALNAVYAKLSLALPAYTDSNLGVSTTTIKAVHIKELRAAVLAVQ